MSKHEHHTPGHPTVGHVSPLPQLFMVFGALVVLTVITVGLSGRLPGATGMLIAMGIATIKATLVALYFMHLRYDRPFNGYLFLAAILFVACFFGITSLDSSAYRKDILPYEETTHQEGAEKAYPRAQKHESLHTEEAAPHTDHNHSAPAEAEAEGAADAETEAAPAGH